MATTSSVTAPPDRGRVLGTYRIFWNKPTPSSRVMVLQFPNRDPHHPYNAASDEQPLCMRIKPRSGLVELDVPMHISQSFNRARGLEFGKALKRSRVVERGGTFGIGGGFGADLGGRTARQGTADEGGEEDGEGESRRDRDNDGEEGFEKAMQRGEVMDKITLGGRIRPWKDGDPIYALGAFKGDELHLTRVDAFCILQPQFHHLDAMVDNEKANSRAQREGLPAQETEARAVNVAVRSGEDEDLNTSEVSKILKTIQEEKWQDLEWVDEMDSQSFTVFEDKLVLSDEAKKSNRLVSSLTAQQYLDAISAPRVDPTYQGRKIMSNNDWASGSDLGEESDEGDGPTVLERTPAEVLI